MSHVWHPCRQAVMDLQTTRACAGNPLIRPNHPFLGILSSKIAMACVKGQLQRGHPILIKYHADEKRNDILAVYKWTQGERQSIEAAAAAGMLYLLFFRTEGDRKR